MNIGLITELWLPRHYYAFEEMWNLGFSSPPQKLISNHFFLILLPMIECYNFIRPTNVLSYIMIKVKFAELWLPKSVVKCQFLFGLIFGSYTYFEVDFWKYYLLWIFALATNLKHAALKVSYAKFTLIINIFGASQVQRTFRLDSVLNVVSVVFGQYCPTSRVIISMMKRDNRLLDGCFGKLKRLPISIISYIFK